LTLVNFNADGLVNSHYPAIGFFIVNHDLFALFGATACFKRSSCGVDAMTLIHEKFGDTGEINEATRVEEVA